ncbi:MAG: DUF389 domain-containing protein [Halioglobus sp.]
MNESSEAIGQIAPCLLHDDSFDTQILPSLTPVPTLVPWSQRDTIKPEAVVLLCLSDDAIREAIPLSLEGGWKLGLLPHAQAHESMSALGVTGTLEEVYARIVSADPIEVDVLTCNGEVVFTSVVVGRVLALRPLDLNRRQTPWSMFKGAFKGIGKLRLHGYGITTGKERKVHVAALGLIALTHTQSRLLGRVFADKLSARDGRLTLLAFAPRSVVSYLWFLLRLVLPGKLSLSPLPSSLASIESDRVVLDAPKGMEYLIDGKPASAKEIEFTILEKRLRLLPGPALGAVADVPAQRGKDSVRLNHTPVDAAARPLVDVPLPLFTHASEEDYRDLFVSLRESAKTSSSYQVLTVLSVLLALVGLYANSAPVIIGAMILAPLMAPIVSLAMGLARTESGLIKSSISTLSVGIAWGLGVGMLLALAMPLEIPTAEMKARMSPTLLDLLVAVVSGVAGAYAFAKEEVAKSLAGVAIAVALVPPLSVAGIGLGWGDWAMAGGALLLLSTNLVGIALAASATFLVMGFAPFSRARKGLGAAMVVLLLISIPLYVSFQHLVERDHILETVPTGTVQLSGVQVEVSGVRVRLGPPHVIYVVLSSPISLAGHHVDELKRIIGERLDEPIILEAQLNVRR